MNWTEEAAIRLKKRNQVLFAKDSEYVQDLIAVFQTQDHRVMALWAFDFAEESIRRLEEKYPGERRPREAWMAAQDWAAGNIKMRTAQRKILDCHAFAKELDCQEDIAVCHSIGQACSVVHTAGHAIGYPLYDMTSIVYKLGLNHCAEAIEQRKKEYFDRLAFWNERIHAYNGKWADFMLK